MPSSDRNLAAEFAGITRELSHARGVGGTLQRIVELAAKTIDGCEYAGISLVHKKRIETANLTGVVPHLIDQLQTETDEGPCLDSIREHEVFETDDLSEERRWPRFAPRAVQLTGVRSMLSMRLYVDEDTLGALNLYSTEVAAFDDDDRSIASIYAAHAAVALQAARRQEQFTEAVASRDIIGQAKGILMARQHLDADTAFQLLQGASNTLHRKLRDIAQDVVDGQGGRGD